MGRKAPRKRLACRVMARPTGALAPHPNVSRRSAHPSLGLASKEAKPGRSNAGAGTKERVLTGEVNCAVRGARPHPEERARRGSAANANVRARVSKDEDGQCARPHASRRIAARQAVGRTCLASRCDAPQHEGGEVRGAFWRNEPNPPQSGRPRYCYARPGRHRIGHDTNLRLQESVAGLGSSVSRLFFTGNRATPTC
jgi:hypothetical protein